MSNSLIARRYARAYYRTLAADNDEIELKKQLEGLEALAQLFTNPSIKKVLVSPVMPSDLKIQILEYAVQNASGGAMLLRLIKTVVDAGRVGIFADLADIFRELINERIGVIDAEVVSVIDLSDTEKQSIERQLESLTKKKVNLTFDIDKDLLGGILVRMGNDVIDMSLKSRLGKVARNAVV